MSKLMLISFVFLCTLTQTAFAASERGDLTIAQILDMALAKNPELRAVELEAKSLSETADLGARWEDPIVEIGAETSNQPVNAPTGDTHFGKLSVSQQIPRPGRLGMRRDGLRALSRIGALDQEHSKIELSAQVLRRIYAFKIADERLLHYRERVRRLKTVDTFISNRSFASPQREAEANITKSKVALLEKQFRQFALDRSVAWNDLNLYLDLQAEPSLKVNWFKRPAQILKSEWLAKSAAQNTELRKQRLKVDYQRALLSSARIDSWSGVTLTASYSDGAGANPQRNYGLGLAFPIPLLNGNQSAIRSSATLLTAEEARLEWSKRQVAVALESAYEKLQSTANSLTLLPVEDSGPSERAMRRIDEAFKKGQVELITYLEADAQHFEQFDQALQSQMEYLNSLIELHALVGEAPQLSEI